MNGKTAKLVRKYTSLIRRTIDPRMTTKEIAREAMAGSHRQRGKTRASMKRTLRKMKEQK